MNASVLRMKQICRHEHVACLCQIRFIRWTPAFIDSNNRIRLICLIRCWNKRTWLFLTTNDLLNKRAVGCSVILMFCLSLSGRILYLCICNWFYTDRMKKGIRWKSWTVPLLWATFSACKHKATDIFSGRRLHDGLQVRRPAVATYSYSDSRKTNR